MGININREQVTANKCRGNRWGLSICVHLHHTTIVCIQSGKSLMLETERRFSDVCQSGSSGSSGGELITKDRSPPPTPPYTHRVSNLSLTLDWPPLSINWYCLHYKLHFTLSEHPSSKLDFNPPLFQTPSDWRHPPWSSSCRRSRSARWRSTAAPSTRTSQPGLESCCSDSPPSAQSPPPSSSSSSSWGSSARPPSRPWYGTCSSQATASSGQALIHQLTPPRIRSLVSDPS